jgi:signal transduction histidine kinase
MIGLFLEHIALMTDLERQIKLISAEKLDMEKKARFFVDQMGGQFGSKMNRRLSTIDRFVEEIERSKNMSLLAELASGVAHQMRNPLSNLLYGLHLLKQPTLSEDEKQQLIDNVTERVETINRMINQFIHYTRIPDLKLSPQHLNELLNSVLCSFREWMRLANVQLVTYFDPEVGLSRMDSFLMSQALHSIIKNSMEAMHSSGCLRVTTRKLRIKHGTDPVEFAEIVVEDDGPGVDSEDFDKIMRPFYSKKEGGLGLGLPMVDNVIRAHGGAITLENCTKNGLRVKIYLPIR